MCGRLVVPCFVLIAFWVAVGIPVAMLATIGVMWLLGQTINMFTLFALIMMLGVIVDDAQLNRDQSLTQFRPQLERLQSSLRRLRRF